MVLLKILSGTKAGQSILVRQFPCAIGRANDANLPLEDPGIWDRHLELGMNAAEGFTLNLQSQAWAALNGQGFQRSVLRNGDLIEIGPVKIRFWLSETQQRNLRWREGLTWIALAALCLGQIALVYWLS